MSLPPKSMLSKDLRNIFISIFVALWLCVFHYESIRYYYLQPHFHTPLPKLKFLFPPAGWIMFYNVDDRTGYAQVYGLRKGAVQLIDPHEIIRTRFIGFDMVHRNVLSEVLLPGVRKDFCNALQKQFPEFEKFIITAVDYLSLIRSRFERTETPVYQCP